MIEKNKIMKKNSYLYGLLNEDFICHQLPYKTSIVEEPDKPKSIVHS